MAILATTTTTVLDFQSVEYPSCGGAESPQYPDQGDRMEDKLSADFAPRAVLASALAHRRPPPMGRVTTAGLRVRLGERIRKYIRARPWIDLALARRGQASASGIRF